MSTRFMCTFTYISVIKKYPKVLNLHDIKILEAKAKFCFMYWILTREAEVQIPNKY